MYLNIYICTIVLNLPLFIHNNTFIINPLNTIDYSMTLLSIIQGFIQLEFHLQFKNMIIIKIIRELSSGNKGGYRHNP